MSMFPIASQTVGAGGASSITFSSIPQTFTHLQLRIFARSSSNAAGINIPIQFNGDAGANYRSHYVGGTGASAISGDLGASQTSLNAGWTAGNTDITNGFGCTIVDILDYANTNKNKTTRSIGGIDSNGSGLIGLWSGLWMSTAAVNQIVFSAGTLAQYTRADLYGISTSNATGA